MEAKRPVKTVHVSFDYGTTKVAVAFWIGFPGTQPLDSEICDVSFGSHANSPQKVAFIEGKCYQGHGLDAMLRDGLVKQEEVIDYLKVLFYKSHATSKLAEKASKQLREHAHAFGLDEDATADQLRTHALALQLEDLMEHVEEAIRTDGEQHFSISPEEIKACPRKIFISVPGMWTPPGNRCITEAAKRAGFENVHLVFEPQAAAAYWLQKIKPTKSGVYKPGDRIQVLDVGGGTSDAIGYVVREATNHSSGASGDSNNEAATFKLVSMGDATGRLCGSEFINLAFLRWLPKHINAEHLRIEFGGFTRLRQHLKITQAELDRHIDTGFSELKHAKAERVQACYMSGMPKMLQDLRLTEAEFLDRANREFGRLKVRLDEREFHDPVQKMFINGRPKADFAEPDEDEDDDSAQGNDTPEAKVLIKKEVFHSFYEPVLQENFELIRDLKKGDAQIKSIIVIGGLRNSPYFMERLEQEFPEVTIVGAANSSVGQPHPVARGALWAFSIVQPQSLACTDSYGIAEDQELHAETYGNAHHDLIDDSVGIVKDKLDPEIELAASRWRTAVKPGLPNMRTERTSFWQWRLIKANEEDIWLSIYWSASERNEHSRIFVDTEHTELIDGVEEFACLKSGLPDLSALGFKLHYTDKKLATMRRKAADGEADDGDFTGDSDYELPRPSARSRKRLGKSVSSRAKMNKPAKKVKARNQGRKNCKNCGARIENDPESPHSHCDSCSDSACYMIYTRLVVETTGANIRVRWEMMADPRKSNMEDLDKENFDARDLHVLHDDAVVQSAFNPNPIT